MNANLRMESLKHFKLWLFQLLALSMESGAFDIGGGSGRAGGAPALPPPTFFAGGSAPSLL